MEESGMSDNNQAARDWGLLLLRVGIGLMFMYHGYPKLAGGPEKWYQLGSVMGLFGFSFYPHFWGFAASIAEFAGGICLVLGVFFRPAALVMLAVMATAASMHLKQGDGIQVASHAIEAGIVFLGLFIIGPGKYALGKE